MSLPRAIERGRVFLVLAGLCAALALAPAGGLAQQRDSSPPITPPESTQTIEPRADLTEIEHEVMCPICGTTLGLSEAPQADRQRAFIRELIAEGKTKDEIKDALVAEYGEEVLAVPGTSGFDLAAWIVPGAIILAALVGIGVGLRRWRSRGGGEPPGASRRLAPADDQRLEADLARYDL